jgi:hypothetical protein
MRETGVLHRPACASYIATVNDQNTLGLTSLAKVGLNPSTDTCQAEAAGQAAIV